MAVEPVRVTDAGAWFRPSDGGAGSLLRLADGVPEEAVRRVRDLRVAGLLPIGNVVLRDGGGWLRTPQPPGPTLADLLADDTGLTTDDAVAVVGTVGRVLRAVQTRGICHGAEGRDSVLGCYWPVLTRHRGPRLRPGCPAGRPGSGPDRCPGTCAPGPAPSSASRTAR